MLNYIYHVAFEASDETVSVVYGEDKAAFEGLFVGKHTGEFAGIPPTGNDVRVPLTVFYDVENGKIKRTRVSVDNMTLMTQLGVISPSAAQA